MNIKKFLPGLLLMLALDCGATQQSVDNTDAEVAVAKAAIKTLAGALQMELKGAMQAGGPVAAIGVCNTRAMPITTQVANDHDMVLSRVSLGNRNLENAPNAWQRRVLEDFEEQKLSGKDVASLAWSETTGTDNGREFRFMKAIPTAAVCLKCHGATLAPEVSSVLNGLYPEDRATGFSEGDIRGAFVAIRKLPN